MTPAEIRQANELMWAVKGHLIPEEYSEEDIQKVLNGYFKRMWGNHEYTYRMDGFEEAWQKKVDKKAN